MVIMMDISLPNHLDKLEILLLEYTWRLASPFFHDVAFIIHTTKVVLLKMKHSFIVHIDTNYDTAGSGENLHNSSCILSNALTVLGKVLILRGERFGRI